MITGSTIISLVFWTVAAGLNAAMDMMFNMYTSSVFTKLGKWFNPYESWVLKWKNKDEAQGEKFFGSSTFLVWVTDGWHLLKMLFLLFMLLTIYFFNGTYIILIYPLLWFISFELTKKALMLKK